MQSVKELLTSASNALERRRHLSVLELQSLRPNHQGTPPQFVSLPASRKRSTKDGAFGHVVWASVALKTGLPERSNRRTGPSVRRRSEHGRNRLGRLLIFKPVGLRPTNALRVRERRDLIGIHGRLRRANF